MKKVDVVYLYEHAARELDVACAVTALLEREYKLSVEIVQWPVGFPEALLRVRPRLVIFPFCYDDTSYTVLLSFWRDSVFLNLSWEQLFYLGNRTAKTPRGKFALSHVLHHVWSSAFAGFLMEAGVPRKNIFINGHPAYTLYDKPYRQYFLSRAELADRYNLDSALHWVFFPENYNWAFYSDTVIRRFIENGQSPRDMQVMREYCDRSLKEVLRWCADAAHHNQVEIILRPRPATALEDFQKIAGQVLDRIPARLHITKQGTVREWILASDVVVSSHSTSLIEAAVAGKQASIVAPFPIPHQLHVNWHDLLPHITTYQDFLGIVEKNESQPVGTSLGHWARQTMMAHGDSIRNLAEYIAQIILGEVELPRPTPPEILTPWLRVVPPSWLWSIYRQIKLFVRHYQTRGIEPGYIHDYVPSKEVRRRIQGWRGIFDRWL